MRKKFLLIVLIPLMILSLIVYIFIDSWITSGLEYAGEKAVGAKVEIEGLHVHLFPLGIEWAAMQVANPNDTWKNLFQTGKVSFLINTGQLLRGKYIVNIVELKDFIVGTKRTSDGALPKEKVVTPANNGANQTNTGKVAGKKPDNGSSFSKLAEDAFKNTVTTTPLFDLAKLRNGFNVDSLMSILDMKSVKHIDTLKTQIDQLSGQWSTLQKDLDAQKQKAMDIEKQVKAIDVSKLNNLQNVLQAINTVDNARKSVNEIKDFVNEKTSSLQGNAQIITGSVGQLKNYVNQDFDKLKSMAKLPSINTAGMASLLVGNEMYKRAQSYLYWADAARTNIKKYSPQPDYTYPPRFKGQDIRFPEDRGYPKFWIKKVDLSGGTDKSSENYFTASGDAENISDNQHLTGQPITIALQGTTEQRALKLGAMFDRRSDVPEDEFNVSLAGVPVSDFSLGNSNFLPTKVTKANMDTQAKLAMVGNRIDATIKFDLKDVNLQFQSEPKNVVEQLFRQVLEGVKNFNIGMRMWNTDGPFKVALSTDLDDVLAQKVSAVVGQEIAKLQSDLRAKFDAKVQEQMDKFNKVYEAKLNDVKNQIGSYQSLLNDQLNIIDKKKQELLDKQKKGFLQDKLKGLFK
jgi:uncharacterized protein (TIGR03545 family)